MTTNDNIYIPTPAEQKLLDVLFNPEHFGKNIRKLCSEAGVVHTVYYDAMKKPEFVRYYNDMFKELLKGKVGDIIAAAYKFATTEAKCHQDRKMLLEMAGEYREEKDINLQHSFEDELLELLDNKDNAK